MKTWQLQDAKAQFSRIVNDANEHGPQAVTRHGILAAVIVGATDYKNLAVPKHLALPDLEARFKRVMGKRRASVELADAVTSENRSG